MKIDTRVAILSLLVALGSLVVGIKQCQLAEVVPIDKNTIEIKKDNNTDKKLNEIFDKPLTEPKEQQSSQGETNEILQENDEFGRGDKSHEIKNLVNRARETKSPQEAHKLFSKAIDLLSKEDKEKFDSFSSYDFGTQVRFFDSTFTQLNFNK